MDLAEVGGIHVFSMLTADIRMTDAIDVIHAGKPSADVSFEVVVNASEAMKVQQCRMSSPLTCLNNGWLNQSRAA